MIEMGSRAQDLVLGVQALNTGTPTTEQVLLLFGQTVDSDARVRIGTLAISISLPLLRVKMSKDSGPAKITSMKSIFTTRPVRSRMLTSSMS